MTPSRAQVAPVRARPVGWRRTLLGGVLLACARVHPAAAVEIDLGQVTCQRYQDEILHPPEPAPGNNAAPAVDPIDTTMWLLGFSIGKAGEHVMYGDALTSFGFALDAHCRNNPTEPLLRAVTATKSKQDSPMDLQHLVCVAWASKHADLVHRDAESATTLMMWMYGFSAARNNVQTLQSAALPEFTTGLLSYCAAHPDVSLFDALSSAHLPGAPVKKPRVRKPQ